MEINVMRRIDYLIGVPLCFLLSGLSCISKALRSKKEGKGAIKKALFIKFSELGAIILAYPLLNKVRSEYPCAELFFATFDENKEIFSLMQGVISSDNILTVRKNNILLFVSDTLKTIKKIQREKIDIVFDLEFFSRYSAIFAYFTKAALKVGFYRYAFEGLYRGNFFTHKIQFNPLNHISKTYLSFCQVVKEKGKITPGLEEMISDKDVIFPEYKSQEIQNSKLRRKLRELHILEDARLFLLNPGEGLIPQREWPLENFITLAKKLLEDSNSYILLIGTEKATRKESEIIKAVDSARCLSLVGQTTLGELVELFCMSKALISNDCGLAHLSMLTPINKYIIFGPESPRIFAPLGSDTWILYSGWPCSPCLSVLNHRNSICSDNKCLKAIKPEDILFLITKTLKK